MIVKNLLMEGFRNYSSESIEFCENINVITGQNAQGKTNLIEAIYYLASGRAFRPVKDKELINFKCDNAIIRANIVSGEREQKLEARMFHGHRRELYANDIKIKKANEFTDKLAVVLFTPDDLSLVRDGAEERRRFLDNALCQLSPGYAIILSEFRKLYDNKTRVLRDHYEKPSLLELLDTYNLRIAEKSAQLIYYRYAYTKNLFKRASKIHSDFTDNQENLSIIYKTVGEIDPEGRKPSQLLPMLMEHQKMHYDAELRAGFCLSGAHKDDMIIEINGVGARKFASQGQARTICVSMKMAERDILCDDRKEEPILLLDDVLSELDDMRRRFILGRIVKGQVFITCCDDEAVKDYQCGNVLKIENGTCIGCETTKSKEVS